MSSTGFPGIHAKAEPSRQEVLSGGGPGGPARGRGRKDTGFGGGTRQEAATLIRSLTRPSEAGVPFGIAPRRGRGD